MKTAIWVGLAGLLVGIGVGWLLGSPQEDWKVWRDRVLRYQRDSVSYVAGQDTLRAGRDSALARAAAAEDSARVSRDRANLERAARLAYQQRADSFAVLLGQAFTPGDSLRACMGEVLARRLEAAACATETAHLRDVVRLDSVGLRSKDTALIREQAAHGITRDRLRTADSLLRVAPAPRRCALPLCAALTLDLEPWDRAFFIGASVPIRTWVRAGVQRRLTERK